MSLVFCSDQCLQHCISNHQPCLAQSSRHRKRPPPPAKPVGEDGGPDVHMVTAQVAAAAIAKGNYVTITTLEDLDALASFPDEKWNEVAMFRAASAKVLPKDF